ncbi:MAG: hypothetical protein V3V22_07495 [Methylococcales bacterium]
MILLTLIMRVVPLSAGFICTTLIILCCYPASVVWRQSSVLPTHLISNFQLNTIKFNCSLILAIAIAGLIALHFYLVAIEILVKPLFAWDAWATWSVKARTWFELKQMVVFVDRPTWLNQIDHSAHVLDAWHYPDTVPLIQTWVALMIDHWDDSLINLPWLFCFFALGLGFYGQLRLLQIPRIMKWISVYILVSLPLINTHVAVAGYADLWLSTAYSFLMLSLMQSVISQSSTQLFLAILLAFCVVLIKIEGVVLLLTVIPIWVTARSSLVLLKRLSVASALLVIGLCSILYFFNEIHLSIPYLGDFVIAYHPVWDAVLINYFELPVWHLLCYLIVIGLLFASFSPTLLTDQRKLALILPITLICYLFVLFFLTQNYSWAKHYSSINRISLHIFPSIIFCLLLIFDQRFHNRHLLSKAA